MFTQQELLAELPRLAQMPQPPFEVDQFEQSDFESPSSEQTLVTVCGTKHAYPSATLFWVKSLQACRTGNILPHAKRSLCSPLEESDFFALLAEYTATLLQSLPPYLKPRPGFVTARKMYEEWNDVAAIAEFTDEFVAFFWYTTA
jgi:hypothetical protein